MSKWKGSYESGRTYHVEWEKEFPWVSKARDGTQQAYCKLCHKGLQPRKGTLKNHAESKEHAQRASSLSSSSTSMFQSFKKTSVDSDKLKRAELQLAVGIICHCPVIAVDHLSEIIKLNGGGSTLENLKLHRTKCSKLITQVISPALEEDLLLKIETGKYYCLLIDESTDIASDKSLCICIRFYDEENAEIGTYFLGLAKVVETTGEALFEALKKILQKHNIDIKKCIGFSSDGASNMTGNKNSLWSRLKTESPNCVKMPCTCHSLALCVQKGFEKLPSNLGFMLKEVPKWFKKSALRRETYRMLFETMNINEERSDIPSPFIKMSETRWLVRGKVIYNILVNWEELKAYFNIAKIEGSQDVRYKARLLWDMFNDDLTYLYFVFASPIVTEFERLNALFQSTNAKPSTLFHELDIHFTSLTRRVYDEKDRPLPLEKIDFGAKFLSECQRLLGKDQRKVQSLLSRCQEMLLVLIEQVTMRLPQSRDIYDGLKNLTPSVVLTHLNRPSYNDLPFLHLQGETAEACENQYRRILYHPWVEEDCFDGMVPDDAVIFWSKVKNYSSNDSKPYEELASYALSCLTTPVSNAFVERVFSHANAIKTKVRNRMKLPMLESILRIRTTLLMTGKCCKDLDISDGMLKKFTSANMYTAPEDRDGGLDALLE